MPEKKVRQTTQGHLTTRHKTSSVELLDSQYAVIAVFSSRNFINDAELVRQLWNAYIDHPEKFDKLVDMTEAEPVAVSEELDLTNEDRPLLFHDHQEQLDSEEKQEQKSQQEQEMQVSEPEPEPEPAPENTPDSESPTRRRRRRRTNDTDPDSE